MWLCTPLIVHQLVSFHFGMTQVRLRLASALPARVALALLFFLIILAVRARSGSASGILVCSCACSCAHARAHLGSGLFRCRFSGGSGRRTWGDRVRCCPRKLDSAHVGDGRALSERLHFDRIISKV